MIFKESTIIIIYDS